MTFRKAQEAGDEKLPGADADALYREAVKAFEEVVRTYPQARAASEALYLIGSSQLMLGDLEKSLAAYGGVVDRYATSDARSRALLRVGVCHTGLDAPLQALAVFQQWLRDYPQESDDRRKVQKYLNELGLVGRKAPSLGTNEWLLGNVGPEGLGTFSGEVIVLLFFATWCENCSEELPHLRRIMRDGAPLGAVFLGVANPEDPKNTAPVDVYVKKNQLDFLDVALDRAFASWGNYRVTGLPAAVLIDRRGRIRWRGHLAFFPTGLLSKALAEK
jgi:thiol-disulfide isomerase/thioredoxin